jgi:N-glycosylase/DNA lyase
MHLVSEYFLYSYVSGRHRVYFLAKESNIPLRYLDQITWLIIVRSHSYEREVHDALRTT